MINISLPDGSVKQFEKGVTPLDVAKSISDGLARAVVSASVNDEIVELNRAINNDCSLRLFTWNDQEGKHTFWHSSAHIMAAAVLELYPNAKFGIGPAIENGFYYDLDFGDKVLSSEDFPKIEAKMQEIAKSGVGLVRKEVSKAEALKFFGDKGEVYKTELIEELEDGTITFYESGKFIDLCKGPHLVDFSSIKAIKILSLAGAYWRGDEKRKQFYLCGKEGVYYYFQ